MRNPDVLRSVVKQSRVDRFNKEVDLSLLALWMKMRNVTNKRLLPQCVVDHTVKDMDVLSQAQGVCVTNNIDPHFSS